MSDCRACTGFASHSASSRHSRLSLYNQICAVIVPEIPVVGTANPVAVGIITVGNAQGRIRA